MEPVKQFATLTRVLIVLCGGFAASIANADRLADIKARGSLACATLTTSEPLGYQDPATRKTVGFDVDTCAYLAKALGVALDLKGVSIEARIPELMVGRVDVVAAALGYTNERAQQIDFSDAYYQVPSMVMVRATSSYHKPSDLAGKKISANKGSTPEIFVRKAIPTAEVLTFQDSPTAFLALQQNKVQGFAITQFAGLRYLNATSGQFRFLDEPVGYEGEALGLPKGETTLLQAVNKALAEMESSGALENSWNRWFGPGTAYGLPRDKKLTPISAFK